MNFTREKYLLESGLPKEIINRLNDNNVMICGGAITAIFSSSSIRDYDVYFRSKESYEKVRDKLIYEVFSVTDNTLCELVTATDVALTLKVKSNKSIIQLVYGLGYFNTVSEVLRNFDFTICQGGFDFQTKEFEFSSDFFKHLSQRRLVFTNKTKYPLCSLVRIKKFLSKGYTISNSEMLRVAMAVNNLRMKTFQDFRQQMMGIDTLFMKDLTDQFLIEPLASDTYDFDIAMKFIDDYIDKHYGENFNE